MPPSGDLQGVPGATHLFGVENVALVKGLAGIKIFEQSAYGKYVYDRRPINLWLRLENSCDTSLHFS